jgi:ribosomal protein S18 acetylase RimI-like enzyme
VSRQVWSVGYNGGMELRPLAPDDLDAALALWDRTEHLGRVPRDEVERLLDHDADLVLAAVADDGELAGVVLGSYDGRRGWVNRLAVAPPPPPSGGGRALVAEVERRLGERGCTRVNLLVFDDNDAGRSLWESLGYVGSEDVVLYSRELADGDGPTSAC